MNGDAIKTKEAKSVVRELSAEKSAVPAKKKRTQTVEKKERAITLEEKWSISFGPNVLKIVE